MEFSQLFSNRHVDGDDDNNKYFLVKSLYVRSELKMSFGEKEKKYAHRTHTDQANQTRPGQARPAQHKYNITQIFMIIIISLNYKPLIRRIAYEGGK